MFVVSQLKKEKLCKASLFILTTRAYTQDTHKCLSPRPQKVKLFGFLR